MMNKRAIIHAIAAAVLTAGCSAAGDEQPSGGGQPSVGAPLYLQVSAEPLGSGGATRAGQGVQGATFDGSETIYAYYKSNVRVGTVTVGSNTVYTTAAAADDKNALTPASQPYFIETATTADIRLYYPYVTGKQVTNTTTSFSVEKGQYNDANYKKSDLMYGKATATRTKTDESVTQHVTLAHRMAKLCVNATPVNGLKIQSIRIVSGYRTISIDTPEECTLGSALSDENNPSDYVEMYQNGTGSTAIVQCAALLPPQTVAVGQNLLQVVTDKGTVTYQVSTAQPFESGRYYQLDLTVNSVDVNSVAIVAWTAAADRTATEVQERLTFNVDGVNFTMIRVAGGDFSTFGGQAVTGTLSDFYLAEFETTNALYKAVMGSVPSTITDDDNPVTKVSKTQMLSFLSALNSQLSGSLPAGMSFKLPTEAQWEYAARGGINRSAYQWPGTNTETDVVYYAWYQANADVDGQKTYAVGQKRPNLLGLYDMAGNVWEVCSNNYFELDDLPSAMGNDPTCTSYNNSDTYISARGGSCNNTATGENSCMVTRRWGNTEGFCTAWNVGFRICLSNGTTLANSKVGDVYGSDGYVYPGTTPLPTGVTAKALIAYRNASVGQSIASAMKDCTVGTTWTQAVNGVSQWNTTNQIPGGYAWKIPTYNEFKQMISAAGFGSQPNLVYAFASRGGYNMTYNNPYYRTSTESSGGHIIYSINGHGNQITDGAAISYNHPLCTRPIFVF